MTTDDDEHLRKLTMLFDPELNTLYDDAGARQHRGDVQFLLLACATLLLTLYFYFNP